MKKILMIRSNPFEPDERVYKEAKSLIENGYDVTLLCWDRELKYPEEEVFEGIKIERIGLKAGYGSLMGLFIKMPLFWIKTFIQGLNRDFDIVHCYDYDTLPIGVWLKIFKRKKLVYDALELFLSYTADKTINNGMFFIERINLPFIDALIYTNKERLKIFLDKTGLKKKVIIIHNYPELGLELGDKENNVRFKNDEDKSKGIESERYDNKIIFQYNGGIKEDRNILNIIKAFKEFKNDNITFLIIGNHYTPYGDILKGYVKENCMEDVVMFHDFVPLEDLLKMLKRTHIGFVPLLKDSLNNLIPEPNKLYNYFATGNLAMVEDTPYLRDIVEDSGLGITCDFSNVQEIKKSIKWILNNPGEVEKMINNAHQKYIDEYNWETQAKKLIKLYKYFLNL